MMSARTPLTTPVKITAIAYCPASEAGRFLPDHGVLQFCKYCDTAQSSARSYGLRTEIILQNWFEIYQNPPSNLLLHIYRAQFRINLYYLN